MDERVARWRRRGSEPPIEGTPPVVFRERAQSPWGFIEFGSSTVQSSCIRAEPDRVAVTKAGLFLVGESEGSPHGAENGSRQSGLLTPRANRM